MCRPCGTFCYAVCRIVLPGFRPWRDAGDLQGARCVRISATVEPSQCGGFFLKKNIHLYIEDNYHLCIFANFKLNFRAMKITELKRILKDSGCHFLVEGKNHEWWWSPITERRFQLPRHSTADVGKTLMGYVREQSGVNVK